MAEGLQYSYYTNFLSLLWGGDSSSYLTDSNSNPDQEWESFSSEISKICNKFVHSPSKSHSPAHSVTETTAWDFLLSSRFHAQYRKQSSASMLSILAESGPTAGLCKCNYGREQGDKELSYHMHLREVLDSLHALYESLKLNILRKK
jgi:anaphase-promoting complex subunit 1